MAVVCQPSQINCVEKRMISPDLAVEGGDAKRVKEDCISVSSSISLCLLLIFFFFCIVEVEQVLIGPILEEHLPPKLIEMADLIKLSLKTHKGKDTDWTPFTELSGSQVRACEILYKLTKNKQKQPNSKRTQ